jgi:hypothetical protein
MWMINGGTSILSQNRTNRGDIVDNKEPSHGLNQYIQRPLVIQEGAGDEWQNEGKNRRQSRPPVVTPDRSMPGTLPVSEDYDLLQYSLKCLPNPLLLTTIGLAVSHY